MKKKALIFGFLGLMIFGMGFSYHSKNVKAATNGWVVGEDGKEYWYENGVKQGTEGRGKEIYDPESNAWYWLDAVQGGAKTVSKDVYQESEAGIYGGHYVDGKFYGKWVRYDENGHMVKGWSKDGMYYFDPVYGTMAKGITTIDGVEYVFDEVTGEYITRGNLRYVSRVAYYDLKDGIINSFYGNTPMGQYWYENGVRQGYSVCKEYRGKEVYDPESGCWYWLDNIQDGAIAKDKDVYQESLAGPYGAVDNGDGTRSGKWVRYNELGQMVKGWSRKDGKLYYFDRTYGTMVHGDAVICGKTYHFNEVTGAVETPVGKDVCEEGHSWCIDWYFCEYEDLKCGNGCDYVEWCTICGAVNEEKGIMRAVGLHEFEKQYYEAGNCMKPEKYHLQCKHCGWWLRDKENNYEFGTEGPATPNHHGEAKYRAWQEYDWVADEWVYYECTYCRTCGKDVYGPTTVTGRGAKRSDLAVVEN